MRRRRVGQVDDGGNRRLCIGGAGGEIQRGHVGNAGIGLAAAVTQGGTGDLHRILVGRTQVCRRIDSQRTAVDR